LCMDRATHGMVSCTCDSGSVLNGVGLLHETS
jgi:hypothetical protein